MTQRQLDICSYICCAALAVGSLGPWIGDPSGYSGTDTGGVLTLAGAGVAASATWRWTVSLRRLMLIITQLVALLCIGVSVYAIYDIRDAYIGADGVWVDRVSWGLILTLTAATALLLFSFFQQRRARLKKHSSSGWPKAGLLTGIIATVALVVWIAFTAESDGSNRSETSLSKGLGRVIPAYSLKAAGGKYEGTSWGVWLFGRSHGTNCWGTTADKDEPPSEEGALVKQEEAYCGMAVPPAYWRLAARISLSSGSDRRTGLFYFMRQDVRRLDVQIARRVHGRLALSTIRVKGRLITPSQAHKARLRANFRFGGDVMNGQICVRRVVVFGLTGHRVAETPSSRCSI